MIDNVHGPIRKKKLGESQLSVFTYVVICPKESFLLLRIDITNTFYFIAQS